MCDSRHGLGASGSEEDLAAKTINSVTRLDCDNAVASGACDFKTGTNSPLMKGSVVKLPKLAVGGFEGRQVFGLERLSWEEYNPLQTRDFVVGAHRFAEVNREAKWPDSQKKYGET